MPSFTSRTRALTSSRSALQIELDRQFAAPEDDISLYRALKRVVEFFHILSQTPEYLSVIPLRDVDDRLSRQEKERIFQDNAERHALHLQLDVLQTAAEHLQTAKPADQKAFLGLTSKSSFVAYMQSPTICELSARCSAFAS